MKQKLYTKTDKGRYEEYQIPDMDVSETLFRRINGNKKIIMTSSSPQKSTKDG